MGLLFKKHPAILSLRQVYEYARWNIQGRQGAAAHLYKQKVLAKYAKDFKLGTLVETGTYLGEMVNALKSKFEKIYSIELFHDLYVDAVKKFARYKHIKIVEGDSAKVLPELLPDLQAGVLFWLDGHYSGGGTAKGDLETPIMKELESIFRLSKQPYVILIDDARLFVGANDYPTLESLETFVQENNSKLTVEVDSDIIRIFPKS